MTKIQWTEKTWNPIVGCSVVSPGCTNCYAMKMANRLANLQLMTRAEHNRLHNLDRGRCSKTGRLLDGRVWNEMPKLLVEE